MNTEPAKTRVEGVTGFVLVGGRSLRLGLDKASFRVEGKPAADRLASMMEGVCSHGVLLVGRQDADWSSYPIVPDEQTHAGPIAGVATALERSPTSVAVIVATDLWNLSERGLRALVRACADSDRSKVHDVAYAVSRSGSLPAQPLCSAWKVDDCLPVVRSRLTEGRHSMFGLLEDLRSVPVEFDDVELVNINRPEDLEKYQRGSSIER